jgi:dipeptide/tripeptide permease
LAPFATGASINDFSFLDASLSATRRNTGGEAGHLHMKTTILRIVVSVFGEIEPKTAGLSMGLRLGPRQSR